MKQFDIGSTIIAGSLFFLAGFALYGAGGPLKTPDAWFHLKMGEVYLTEGLWPDADPLLHTAHENAPVQHEWLFGVVLHGLHRMVGFHGLRVVHALIVAGILWLAWSIFYRQSESDIAACWATCVFIVLSWWRLWQLRPDLVTIPAALLLYRILLERDRAVTWRRVAMASLLLLVWANFHSLFSVGLGLLIAALLGRGFGALLRRAEEPDALDKDANAEPDADADSVEQTDPRATARLAAMLGIGVLVTLVNPRGLRHHLTFLESSRQSAIWSVSDEWKHFNPFAWRPGEDAVSLTGWLTMQMLFVTLLLVAGMGLVRVIRERTVAARHRLAPEQLGLALAAVLSVLVSVRFFWMAFLILLYLLRAWRPRLQSKATASLRWWFAGTSLVLALAFPMFSSFKLVAPNIPGDFSTYVAQPYATRGLHEDAVQFLEESGVRGNLFNEYAMGGFLGYRLAPAIRTFVDGRTEHYPADVLYDYFRIWRPPSPGTGETMLETLDRRGVDLFFGVGLPVVGQRYHTTTHLQRAPDWMLIYRSLDNAIYLRVTDRNRENLRRVSAYYANLDIPFDPGTGFDPLRVISARPQWAAAHGMIPPNHAESLALRESPDQEVRLRALDQLGSTYALLGAFAQLIEVEREAARLNQVSKVSLRRLTYGLLHLDRTEETLDAARSLVQIDRQDTLSRSFLLAASRRASEKRMPIEETDSPSQPPGSWIDVPPLFTQAEFLECCSNYP